MKKTIIFIATGLMILSSSVFAKHPLEVTKKTSKDFNGTIQTEPFSLGVGITNVNVNFKLTDALTIGPHASFCTFYLVDSLIPKNGGSFGINMNYAPSGDILGHRVWLINPYISYESYEQIRIFSEDEHTSGLTFGTNLLYQWVEDDMFIRAGVGVFVTNAEVPLGIGGSNVGGLLSLSIGFAY